MWKEVGGYEGLYSVSDDGRVFSHKTRGEVKPYGNDCLQVQLYKNGERKIKSVARLVAEAFIPLKLNVMHPKIVHINGNPADNRVENLKWVVYSNGSFERGGKRKRKRLIWAVDTLTEERFKFDSVNEASELLGVSRASIYACLNRQKDKVKGYEFYFE